jgi:hypothetical protein
MKTTKYFQIHGIKYRAQRTGSDWEIYSQEINEDDTRRWELDDTTEGDTLEEWKAATRSHGPRPYEERRRVEVLKSTDHAAALPCLVRVTVSMDGGRRWCYADSHDKGTSYRTLEEATAAAHRLADQYRKAHAA